MMVFKVDRLKAEYDVHIDNLTLRDLDDQSKNNPFQFVPSGDRGGRLKLEIIANRCYYFNGSLEVFQARIMRNYDSDMLASKSVEDFLAHEFAHVMTFKAKRPSVDIGCKART